MNYNRIGRYERGWWGDRVTRRLDDLQRVHRLEELVHPLDLAGLIHTRSRQARLLPGQRHARQRLEVVVPDGLRGAQS